MAKKDIENCICVDAACSGNPGITEYKGVDPKTGEIVFYKNVGWGTNNIGEFLAIVHALALFSKKEPKKTIYTDSMTALSWVKQKKCKTTLKKLSPELKNYLIRAEIWLKSNTWTTPIKKWDTKNWGEIPADFGRK